MFNNLSKKAYCFYYLAVILSPSLIFSQEVEEKTKFDFQGNYRVRGFNLARDIYTSRQTSATPYDKGAFKTEQQQRNQNIAETEITEKLKGNPSTLSPQKEDISYFDTRMTVNMNFNTSKYFEALWGVQVGDITFGGKGFGQNSTTGPGQGGEANSTSPVNIQTTFLYLNFKLPEDAFSLRVGQQLFFSPRGRVIFASGTGITINKDFRLWNTTIESGWFVARQNAQLDLDKNAYADKNYVGTNIYFYRIKTSFFNNVKHELYSYFLDDTIKSIEKTTNAKGTVIALDSEFGQLFWHGFMNEINLSNFGFVVHGIYNHGTVHVLEPYRDNTGNVLYNRFSRHNISGGMLDLQFSYRYSENFTFNLIGVGTTGRPGFDKDGTRANLRGGGYKTLMPGYSISNIGHDFTGGYALFSGKDSSGLYEYGVNGDFVVYGPLLLTLGYYRLYGTKSPYIENNRYFNFDNGYKTSTFFGHEVNINLRWNAFRDMQILMRSGYFIAGDGLKAYLDTTYGKILREFFVTAEHRF
ncbi:MULTISPECIES: hypothetical protein [Leptospira]|uniref:PF13372 domain protein n=1 Tax=Leptospira borgpetersenii serovar Javanica str. UI 09931 TaxID=1049767 RepID=A0AAV3JCK1_LEPBO|nr:MULTISPECIES: hypothetical protein [Leptospira]AXX17044.1 hypothetical protein C4Q31_17350 [Leptospira borgpetersenii serovar Ceylonica]EKQ91076.1 hypothetical protein LEP1GSC101_0880 [Leptospira borgpetersenii str. UI 09149]EMK14620.1 hypothetical protein LEP1GSC066_3508 [Leptospira sp. serovar Kenya str. Sh9]EMN59602.1 hypothetical protein LEP1GSC090_1779 [Leptospira borgpetersenii serovar Javanica str. MK146]EPG58418.1 hypothetical protein LEP1GSC103_2481 [Leptospira borgpetersenii serov